MAPSKAAALLPSFDDIVQAGRQKEKEKKKKEVLANQIFGKSRRTSTPLQTAKGGGSLASRITKPGQARSASTSSLHRTSRPHHPRPHPPTGPSARSTELFQHMLSTAFGPPTPPPAPVAPAHSAGFSIRGLAGPTVVVGRNFAPGTTSADIQSAMEAVGGEMVSCTIVHEQPVVVAEMVWLDRVAAEAVVGTFDGQKADGRILKLYFKKGPSVAAAAAPMVSERPYEGVDRRDPPAEVYPVEKGGRRAEPEIQDGSLGFETQSEKMVVDVDAEDRYTGGRGSDRSYQTRRDDRPRENGNGRYESYGRDERGESRRGPAMGKDVRGFDTRGGRDERGLYSDGLYQRSRGGGYR